MNVRLIAGVAILALIFGAWFVGFGLDEGWLVATMTTVAGFILAALVIAAVKLIFDGMDQR